MPFVNFCGPSAVNQEVESALLKRAYTLAKENRVDFLEIRSPHVCDSSLPQSQHKVSMTVPLDIDPEKVWASYQSKHRTNIRRVYKSGISVRSGGLELLDEFYKIMCLSWRNLGTPIYHKSYFHSLVKTFGNQVRIFVAYLGDTPVATAFNGYYDGTVEGMWAGINPKYRNLQINYVLYWEMIKDACLKKCVTYNFGRSSVSSGGESFKKKWGASSQQLYWQYFLPKGGEIPELNVTNPKFQYAILAWQKLPIWATQLVGPRLARNIP